MRASPQPDSPLEFTHEEVFLGPDGSCEPPPGDLSTGLAEGVIRFEFSF